MRGRKRILLIAITAVATLAVICAVIFATNRPADNTARLLSLGEKYLTELDYEQALVQFLQVIEIDPKNPRGYTGAAEAYVGLGRVDDAIAVLELGLERTGSEEIRLALDEIKSRADSDSDPIGGADVQDSPSVNPSADEPEQPQPTIEPLRKYAEDLIDEIKAALRNHDAETAYALMNGQAFVDYFGDRYHDSFDGTGFDCWRTGVSFFDATKDENGYFQDGAYYLVSFTLTTDDSGDFGSSFTYAEITNGQYTGASEHWTKYPDGNMQSHMRGFAKDGVFSGTYDYYDRDTGEVYLTDEYTDGYGEISFSRDEGVTMVEQKEAYRPMGTASPNDREIHSQD